MLLNLTKRIEAYLVDIAQNNQDSFLLIDLNDLEQAHNDFIQLSPQKINWMINNIGFEAVRYPVGI